MELFKAAKLQICLAVVLSSILAFSLVGMAPMAAYAAEGEGASASETSTSKNDVAKSVPVQQEPTAQTTETQNPKTQTAETQNPTTQNPEPQNPEVQQPEPQKPEPQQPEVQKPKPKKILEYKNTKVTKAYKAGKFTNKLTKNTKGKITYTSSNKKVATVSSSGKVTIKGIGTATITAKAKATKKTKAASAKYTLIVNPRSVNIASLKKTRAGFYASWKARSSSEAAGYQVRYSQNKNMKASKTVTVKKASSTYRGVSGLKGSTTYYVQLRAYCKVKGKTYYSDWSKTKSVKSGNGKSLSGDAALDKIVDKVLDEKIGRESGALKRAFKYVESYKYKSGSKYPKGNWSVPFAKQMYNNKGGNCYRYAALFNWLAKGLGYNAKAVTGYVPHRGGGWAPHGWVEIKKNGKTYVCDTELSHALKGYNFYMVTYKKAPVTYKKSK